MGLLFPFPEPAVGEPQPLRGGVSLLRMPLPFALNHINLWRLEHPGGWSLVDTGIATDACRAHWRRLLAQWRDDALRSIVVTHFHPDHFGLAGWLSARTGADVIMSAGEQRMARRVWEASDAEQNERVLGLFTQHGLSEQDAVAMAKRGNGYRKLVSTPPATLRTAASGDDLNFGGDRWTVIGTNGHSPEHLCLYNAVKGLLISGDQLLPRISSNVSVGPLAPEANPLEDFLSSLRRLRDLPEDTLVLPSHGLPFTGLRPRVDALLAHHEDRLDALRRACREPRTAADVLPVLFQRQLDTHALSFAMGEAIAHLHYLRDAGVLERRRDSRGVYRFALC